MAKCSLIAAISSGDLCSSTALYTGTDELCEDERLAENGLDLSSEKQLHHVIQHGGNLGDIQLHHWRITVHVSTVRNKHVSY